MAGKFNTPSARWTAVSTHDATASGHFVYCVRTTSIYCRPTCKARLARRNNITFHDTPQAAEAAGFRPCLRCKPDVVGEYDPQAAMVAKACRTMKANLQDGGKEPSLRELAAEAGLTESHFHRVFKAVMGFTPKGYATSLRAGKGNGGGIGGEGKAEDDDDSVAKSVKLETLTPSGEQSSAATSSGPRTPAEWTQPALPFGWTVSSSLEEAEEESDDEEQTAQAQNVQIEFTVQPWASGYVLVAAANEHVRAIDVSDSHADLVARLRRKFPEADLLLSDWSSSAYNPFWTSNQLLFGSVMEALENPSGKMLNVGPNVFEPDS